MSTTDTSTTSPRHQRFAPLLAFRYYDFRLLWIGSFISLAGSQMRVVAVNWQVYELAKAAGWINPALALGLIGLAQVIPLITTALLSGVVADRVDRRHVMLVAALAALTCSLVLGVATVAARPPLWLVYAIVSITAVASAFELPARQALIPNLVPPDHLPNALSLNIIAWQLATILGPSLAGVVIAWGGAAPVYWIDAGSFLAVALAVLLMRHGPVRAKTQQVSLHAAVEGLRFVFSNRLIASTMLLDFFATFFSAATTLLPIFADRILHVGTVQLGWLYAAPAVGATLAAALLTSISIRRKGVVLLCAVATFGLCTVVFGLSRTLLLTLLALIGAGAADTVSMVIRGTIRQLVTPDELRGRMSAVNMIFFAGGPQLGEVESGIAASLIGAPAAVALGGALCLVATAWIALRVGDLRRYQA